MALLETVPNELFAEILEDLSNSDLASTSLVSRRLRNLSQPLLYREPHLTINDQYPTSFDLFFTTLLTPAGESLGTHARCLTVEWNRHHIRDNARDLTTLPDARAHLVLGDTCISEIGQLGLLLQLLPRLQALHLPRQHESRCGSIWRDPPPHLRALPPTLRTFTNDWPAPANLLDLENLLTVLRLPRIRSIVVHELCFTLFPPAPRALVAAAAGTSSLTHLSIRAWSTWRHELHAILRVPRALTHFAYQPPRSYCLGAIGGVLRPLQHSLTSLLLDCRLSREHWRAQHSTGAAGSLRDWPALRTVTCSLGTLVASDSRGLAAVLPTGIRELGVLDDGKVPLGYAVKELVALLDAAEMVPALRWLRVYAGRWKCKRLRRRLRKACWAKGVAFEDGAIFEAPAWVVGGVNPVV